MGKGESEPINSGQDRTQSTLLPELLDECITEENPVYLSSDPWVANEYAIRKAGLTGHKANTMEFYAGVHNPKIVDTATKDKLSKASQGYIDSWNRQAKKEGHDGVLLDINGTQELVVFDNNRVKSVTGNTGKFNNENRKNRR